VSLVIKCKWFLGLGQTALLSAEGQKQPEACITPKNVGRISQEILFNSRKPVASRHVPGTDKVFRVLHCCASHVSRCITSICWRLESSNHIWSNAQENLRTRRNTLLVSFFQNEQKGSMKERLFSLTAKRRRAKSVHIQHFPKRTHQSQSHLDANFSIFQQRQFRKTSAYYKRNAFLLE
jgi:hypothetical protein